MIATLKGSLDELRQASKAWETELAPGGYVGEDLLVGDEGHTVVATVHLAGRAQYEALANDPRQDEWWRTRMDPLLDDVRWIDGEWELSAR